MATTKKSTITYKDALRIIKAFENNTFICVKGTYGIEVCFVPEMKTAHVDINGINFQVWNVETVKIADYSDIGVLDDLLIIPEGDAPAFMIPIKG